MFPRTDRLRLVAFVLVGCFALLWGRLVHLTLVRHEELLAKALDQQREIRTIPSLRGVIVDRHGSPVAFTVEGSSLAMDPGLIEDPEEFATVLEEYGIAPASRVLEQIRRARRDSSRFVWIDQGYVRESVATSLEKRLGQPLIRIPEPKRLYPLGAAAAPLIGSTNSKGRGLTGLEASYDTLLRGAEGRILDFRSARADLHEGPGCVILEPPQEGATLELTIDARLQEIADAHLRRTIREQNARGGTAILIDPSTGEILALSSFPDFEPEAVLGADTLAFRVWAVGVNYEPGSTYKLVAFAAGVEAGVIGENDLIDCMNGRRPAPGGPPIKDHDPYGVMPAWLVLAKSSNIGTGIIAERVKGEGFFATERLLGFGVPTGVEIPGEERGRIPDPSLWSGRSLITQAFGQEISCTALQLAMAYAAIANDGILMRPRIVRSVRDPDGRTLLTREPEIIRRAVSPETARLLREMLRRAVTDGTGSAAEVESLRPGGKTGTAQKFVRDRMEYSTERYIASFAGFYPYDDPRLVCLVVIDEPEGSIWGGSVAAPVFAAIIEDAAKLDMHPFGQAPRSLHAADLAVAERTWVPRTVGLPAGAARRLVKGQDLMPHLVGSGQCVIESSPEAGQFCRTGDRVTLVLGDPGDSLPAPSRVPDLRGYPLRDALARARSQDLRLEILGAGWVVEQQPAAGTLIEPAMRVRLRLSSDSCRAYAVMRRGEG